MYICGLSAGQSVPEFCVLAEKNHLVSKKKSTAPQTLMQVYMSLCAHSTYHFYNDIISFVQPVNQD